MDFLEYDMNIFDTIAAIGTPLGTGGVAMIRISGSRSCEVADKVFRSGGHTSLADADANKMVYGGLYELSPDGESAQIDTGMAVRYAAPHSYTGEDTVELFCHGGALLTQKVLASVLSAGARQAEAGEFTRRAFLNGKLDLSEAEALGSLIHAKTESQLYLAGNSMHGTLTRESKKLYDALRSMLSSIYARIDFPDEDLSEMSVEEMWDTLNSVLDGALALSSTYTTGRAICDGIKTVICGRTNAGKSSIYNRIVGEDSAIVTDVEGTTRDVLRGTVSLGKTTLRISDTAGIRKTQDTVESIGIERAMAEIEDAELILAVFDGSSELCEDDLALIGTLKALTSPVIALLNKSDLSQCISEQTIREDFEHVIFVSAKENEGFFALSELIDSLFLDGSINIRTDALVIDARQFAALTKAAEAIRRARDAIERGEPLDLCCIDIELAMQSLGELEGREVGEEIVSEIFSKFCVGK